ncbi:MAG: ROK family protein [Candidatus Solibacter usitatus]|nr:ROK family protein [Candidatus Solibacter usitatus]
MLEHIMPEVFAVDIGGTQIKAARVDEQGRVLDSRKIGTPHSIEDFSAAAAVLTKELATGAAAAGFGCKGLVDTRTTVVRVLPGTLHYLEGRSLAELFGVAAIPAAAENDARVALLGERRWGAARGRDDVIFLTLGTGVGGGVLTGGRLLRGSTGAGSHIGHLTVDPQGVPCICGNRGCLETVFSAKAIEAAAFSARHRGVASVLLNGPDSPACEQVFAAATSGDAVAIEIVSRAVYVLGAALAGLVYVFDPEVIVLGGQMAAAGSILFDPIRAMIRERTYPMLQREIPVVRSELDGTGVVGAAALALDCL